MKKIKIFLIAIAIIILGVCTLIWWDSIVEPELPPKPKNQFIERIESEIYSLTKVPVNVSYKKFCEDIQYRITDYHKERFLDTNDNDNNQWKDILSKKLYSACATKFIEFATYVFKGSEWKIDNLKFIRNESKTLKTSPYLEQGSPVSVSIKEIDNILKKYDEIAGFISTCNNFSYSNYDIYDRFPDISDKIKKTQDYLTNNLGNNYVKNCVRLKEGLEAIPQKLFNKHIDYLQTKIQQNANKYEDFNSQYNYNRDIYQPLRRQVDDLDNNIYGIDYNTFDRGYKNLDELLSTYNQQATNYYRQNRRY